MKTLSALCVILGLVISLKAQVIMTPGRSNSNESRKKPYLIIISLDGFRYDYATRYKAQNLHRLAADGVSAERMYASYPSKTFPNHYAIITGLYPSHHGIVDNSFYDPQRKKAYSLGDKQEVSDGTWYGGTPLWVLAENQKMLSASFFWVGSEADIRKVRPTYYYTFDDKIPVPRRIQQVVDWLKLPEDSRPHLITFYLSETDHAGHTFGPDSPEVQAAVTSVDGQLGLMVRRVDSLGLPVNYIVVSDHGMAKTKRDNPILVNRDSLRLNAVKIFGGETQLNLYFEDKALIPAVFAHLNGADKRFDTYLKKDVPPAFHYSTVDDTYDRIGDIVLISKFPEVFGVSGRKGPVGTHGFDPKTVNEMGAVFYAWGPAFRHGLTIPAFENVNVYPLAAHLLGLQISEPIDGRFAVLSQLLIRQ